MHAINGKESETPRMRTFGLRKRYRLQLRASRTSSQRTFLRFVHRHDKAPQFLNHSPGHFRRPSIRNIPALHLRLSSLSETRECSGDSPKHLREGRKEKRYGFSANGDTSRLRSMHFPDDVIIGRRDGLACLSPRFSNRLPIYRRVPDNLAKLGRPLKTFASFLERVDLRRLRVSAEYNEVYTSRKYMGPFFPFAGRGGERAYDTAALFAGHRRTCPCKFSGIDRLAKHESHVRSR